MKKLKGGWLVFIVECADGTFYTDMDIDIRRKLYKINNMEGIYFSKHPERLPVKVVFKEEGLSFKEAYTKFQYLRSMNRKLKKKLIETKKWPAGKIIWEYLKNNEEN